MFDKITRELYRIICNMYVRIKNRHVKIMYGAKVLYNTKFEGYNKIGERCIVGGEFGRCTYMGANNKIIAKVGRYTSIAADVTMMAARHPTDYVSTSPVFFSSKKTCLKTYVKQSKYNEYEILPGGKYSFEIGNDVWIGNGATLVGAIRVGDGAIIAANATVTKDVPPYSIVAGVPAKVIKMRFNAEDIDFFDEYLMVG